MNGPLLWVKDGARDPKANMALDEALLAGDGAWLRTYRWVPHAISLGYFQKPEDFADLPADLPRVHRITGGGAILHANEVTVALALPESLLPGPVADSYALLNDAVVRAVAEHGAAIHRAPPRPRSDSRWCFAAPTHLDLMDTDGHKVFGSAQRRRGGRILWHGSLILARHELTAFTGHLPGILADSLAPSLARELAATLGLELRRANAPAFSRPTKSLPLVEIEKHLAAGAIESAAEDAGAVAVENEEIVASDTEAARPGE
ncbi:MAG: hypothetical protein QGG14_00065 [Planctomycetota bacterium]|jgi:lipoate-protein ligase A|nr:hypothetical protein [Planctomycetota bacterium]